MNRDTVTVRCDRMRILERAVSIQPNRSRAGEIAVCAVVTSKFGARIAVSGDVALLQVKRLSNSFEVIET